MSASSRSEPDAAAVANAAKAEGNAAFAKGDAARAVSCYSKGIAAIGASPPAPLVRLLSVLYTNRALAFKLQPDWSAVEADAVQAIQLDRSNSKARRGAVCPSAVARLPTTTPPPCPAAAYVLQPPFHALHCHIHFNEFTRP